MHARVSFYQLAEGGDIDAAVDSSNKAIATVLQIAGNQGVKLMIDRYRGKAIAITLWDSQETLKLSSHEANGLREQVAGTGGLTIENVEHYEVFRDER